MQRSDPVRPDARLTADGRPAAEVRSYARRGSRLTGPQQRALEAYGDRWLLPGAVAVGAGYDHRAWFGREAPLLVEIGSGTGEAVAALAGDRPSYDVLAVEVWQPGVASTLGALGRAGVGNVRVLALDAAWVLERLLPARSVRELWTFFPDPWPKQRHHKRRLVDAAFASTAAARLEPGGVWRLATDWPEYAAQMQAVLGAEPLLDGGPVPRWPDRPPTRFEQRGLAAGRPVTDLAYRRRPA